MRGTLSVIAFLGLTFSTSAADKEKVFRAGAYAQDITPTVYPISVNGGMSDRFAKVAHDKLHARCLVLDDGTTKIAIVVCDSCMIPREIIDEAKTLAQKATGISTDKMLMSATHTHTAPTVVGLFQSEPDAAYAKYLAQQIAKGVTQAHANLAPAYIGWGVGKDPTQLFNRRWKMKPGSILADPFGALEDKVKMNPGYQNAGLVEPAGPIDPDVSFIAVRSPTGRPLAFFANYSLHYVGGVEPLSADYFGAFAEKMGVLLGADRQQPSFVGAMTNGTSGDINNVNFAGAAPGKREPFEQCKVVAESVSKAAFEAYKQIKFQPWVSLSMAEKEIELGVRLPSETDVKKAEALLKDAKQPYTKQPEIYARETLLMTKFPKTVKAKLQAVRIGELGIVSSPCETFVEIGLEIKAKSPLKPTFTIELANGYNGYLPTPKQHGWGGYETWRARSSYLEVEASPKITADLFALLEQVAKSK